MFTPEVSKHSLQRLSFTTKLEEAFPREKLRLSLMTSCSQTDGQASLGFQVPPSPARLPTMHKTPSTVRVGAALYQRFLSDRSLFPHQSKIRFLFTQKATSKYNYLPYILFFMACYYYRRTEQMLLGEKEPTWCPLPSDVHLVELSLLPPASPGVEAGLYFVDDSTGHIGPVLR